MKSLKTTLFTLTANALFLFCYMLIFVGCYNDSAEEPQPDLSNKAELMYTENLKNVIATKCINCHSYHQAGINRYDTFGKTKMAIGEMIKRIDALTHRQMPPSSAPILTQEEKQLFYEFQNLLNSEYEPSDRIINAPYTIKWTAYKYRDFDNRVGVSGSFDEITYTLNNDSITGINILRDAEVSINTASVNIDGIDGLKTSNIKHYFFPYFAPTITAKIVAYDDQEALIRFTINKVEQEIVFDVNLDNNAILLTGTLPDLNFFNWSKAYYKLQQVCGQFHENKIWADIDLEVHIQM